MNFRNLTSLCKASVARSSLRASCALGFLLAGSLALQAATPANTTATNSNALLQFLDGSSLHGNLAGIEAGKNLAWKHPAATDLLNFTATNLSSVRFESATFAAPEFRPTCRFYFRNGDEVIGNLISISNQTTRLESWIGGNLEAARASMESITFSTRGYKLLYEGPNGTNGWRTGRNPRSWEYRDGTFIANGADLLGRDFGLTTSSTIEFDLAWNSNFSLSITLYAQAIDRFDYSSSAYLLYLGPAAVNLQRVQAGAGASLLGQAQIPSMLRKSKTHFEIRCNKEDATISLFADGAFVQRWRDPSGFVAKGTGVVFFSQVEPKGMKISNIRVAEWDGRFEPDILANLPPTEDVVLLANHDRVMGQIKQITDGKMTMMVKTNSLDIPLARVTQIRFKQEKEEPLPNQPWQVRASFPGGESVMFQLEKWDAEKVSGNSKIFGDVAFKPETIRQLQFNITKKNPGTENEDELDWPEFE
ncbi:MAG: hypothetical protein ACO1QB_12605 [Verrucomicrobiales bacterium]